MKRDSRPVSQQVLSGLKIGSVIGAALVVALISSSYISSSYIRLPRIEAYIWHLRHGNSIDVGQYRLPAPRQWFVESNSESDVFMINLSTGDGIWAHQSGVLKGHTLSEWSEMVSRTSARSQTTKTTGQRDFHINGEMFRCIEQDFYVDPKLGHVYPIQCLSDGGLKVEFESQLGVGREHDGAFYSLLQRIQRL